MSRAQSIILDEDQRGLLESWVRSRTLPHRTAVRAKIVLLAADGVTNRAIGERLSVSPPTVQLWRERFLEGGPDALVRERPGRGRKPVLSDNKVEEIVQATLHTTPANATHWSVRTMAKAQGVSRMMVQRIWNQHRLKPHLVETFKLSNDPQFVDKLRDVVGLYLAPPEHGLVFSVDEKSQIQALDRTQPLLPLRPGVPARQTHDYKRNGTTTLFAALNLLDGTVIADCKPRHRHQEFLAFLKQLDEATPPEEDLHLILDNYCTHKHHKVKAWLARHPRFHLHFIPTSSSWLNLVERWFAEITEKRIRRGTFTSVPRLVQAIEAYVQDYNRNPTRFTWTKSAEAILQSIANLKGIYGTGH